MNDIEEEKIYNNSYAVDILIHLPTPDAHDSQWAIAMAAMALIKDNPDLELSDDARKCLREFQRWGKLDSDRWTPVTESLPESSGEYLVTVKSDIGQHSRKVSSFTTNGVCYSWGIETSPIYDVVAWCELPEPYQEG